MVPEVKVKIGADITEFQTKMAAVQRRLAVFTAAAAAAVAGLGLAVKKQIDIADDLAKMSQRIGLPVEMLSRLSYAADLSGVSLEELATGVRFLSRTMVDMPDKLKELGIATRDAGGNMRSTEDVLYDLADVFASMPDGAQKTAISLDILSRSGTQMIPLLNGGSQALREMMEEARVLGVQIDTRTAKAAEAFNDNLTRLSYAARALTRQLAAAMLPALERVTNAVVRFVAEGQIEVYFQRFKQVLQDVTFALGALALAMTGRAAFALAALVKGLSLATVGANALALAMRRIPFVAIAMGAGVLISRLTGQKTAAERATTAQEKLNEALRQYSVGFADDAAAGAFDVAGAYRDQAKAALVAAQAEYALMQAEWAPSIAQMEQELAAERAQWEALKPTAGMMNPELASRQREIDDVKRIMSEAKLSIEQAKLVLAALDLKRYGSGAMDYLPMDDEDVENLEDIASNLGNIGSEIPIVQEQLNELGKSAQQAFTAFLTGAQSAREALKSLLDQLASQASNKLFELLFGGLNIFSAPAATPVGVSPVPVASAGRGPMAAQRVHITVDEGPMFASRVRAEAQGVSIETVQRGLRQYDSTTLPQSMRRIQREPRVIGR